MSRSNVFLTANWNHLAMLNYAVDKDLLRPHVPAGTDIDEFAGHAWISIVAFEFNRARLSGIPVPFHQAFEEVNLRFYVRRGQTRGVAFIRELVPKHAVAAVARLAFGENYSRIQMSHRIERSADGAVRAEYSFGSGPAHCTIEIESDVPSFAPPDGSLSQFITEHYWGYSAQADGGCIEYEVQHTPWPVRNSRRAKFSGTPARIYGPDFACVLTRDPDSAFLCEGSPVTVFRGRRIR